MCPVGDGTPTGRESWGVGRPALRLRAATSAQGSPIRPPPETGPGAAVLTGKSWDLEAELLKAVAHPSRPSPACLSRSLALLASTSPCTSASGGRNLEEQGGLAWPPLPSPGSGQVAPAKSPADGMQLAPGWAGVWGKRAPCAQREAHSGL